MRVTTLDRTLAAGVGVIAAFNTMASLTIPVAVRKPTPAVAAVALTLLLTHATLYWFGDQVRERRGLAAYLCVQASLVFGVGATGALFPVGFGLYLALTVQAIILAGATMGTVAITLGAITLFAVNAMIVGDLYRGATAGVVLAVSAVIAHAIAALVGRSSPQPAGAIPAEPARGAVVSPGEGNGLTARELEVLGSLAAGARNNEIATELGIAERTVKAHLGSIYMKLGVESRGAAVAAAQSRGILKPIS